MAKLMEKPEEIKVTVNIDGVPVSLLRNAKRERITRIYDRWRVADQWRTKTERAYFRVKISRGLVYDIYHDIANNRWYLTKIHD